MKTIKLFTVLVLTTIMSFTSCQEAEDTQVGENPNANSADSTTANNYKRAGMEDGSEDDFLDDNSCTKLLFPLTAKVNNQEIRILSKLDFSKVLEIMGKFNDDDDTVVFHFPINVRLNNYTEVQISSQQEFDELKNQCDEAEEQGKDAISCIKINFPITMLTYNLNIEQTGSVIIQSKQQLYTFINNLSNDELFAVDYPITVETASGTTVQLESNADFQEVISDCLDREEQEDQAEETAEDVEETIVNTSYKIESFVNAGVEKATEYANYSIKFINDLSIEIRNNTNNTLSQIEGTYSVSSELDVFLTLNFQGNTSFNLLNQKWIVTTFSNTAIELKSKTDVTTTIRFKKI